MPMLKQFATFFAFFIASCSNHEMITATHVDLERFISTWYVIAGRFTVFEKGAHNPIERYSWSPKRDFIQVDFSFNKGSFDGELKHIAQKAWVYNAKTNAHWKISPFWPLKLNYLILAVAEDHSWCAVGVPDQKYLWIMAKDKSLSEQTMKDIFARLSSIGYSVKDIEYAKHSPN